MKNLINTSEFRIKAKLPDEPVLNYSLQRAIQNGTLANDLEADRNIDRPLPFWARRIAWTVCLIPMIAFGSSFNPAQANAGFRLPTTFAMRFVSPQSLGNRLAGQAAVRMGVVPSIQQSFSYGRFMPWAIRPWPVQ